jgi:ribosomal peptide maturation radical SAM protein 1
VLPVAMVCMPFQIAAISSLSTALLATILREAGIPVRECYPHFAFAQLIGEPRYRAITDGDTSRGLLGELLFAEGLHGRSANRALARLFGAARARERLRQTFLDHCLSELGDDPPAIVGLTTSFNQLMPSVWLGSALKKRWPGVRIVLGGSACTGEMGAALAQAYPFIDCIVSGNGERVILSLAREEMPWPTDRLLVDEAPVDLNQLPVSDYTAFVAEAERYGRTRENMMLAYETSRGCWWGEKHHCTFCGINGAQMKFTAKTPDRAYTEIRELWQRYQRHLFATDSILAIEQLHACLPRLAADQDRPVLFYEVKANLRARDVRLLHDASVMHIQPGIESLSTHVLDLLRKGVRMLQNVALLKWCRELGIRVSWNLLYGVPGEEPDDYRLQAGLMRRIPHLTPPSSLSRVRIDRFSPYFHRFKDYGWKAIHPLNLYSELHPSVPASLVEAMAYHFDGEGGVDPAPYERDLHREVARWHEAHTRGDGLYWDRTLGLFHVRGEDVQAYEQSDTLAELIRLTNAPIGIARVREQLAISDADWEALVADGVLLCERNQVLNLAVRLESEPADFDREPVESALRILAVQPSA